MKHSQSDYAAAFAALPMPAVLVDLEGLITDLNPAFLSLARDLGCPLASEQAIGAPISSLAVHQQTREPFEQLIARGLRGKSGRLHWRPQANTAARPIDVQLHVEAIRNARGAVDRVLVFYELATQQVRRTQPARHQDKAQLESIVNSIGDIVYQLDTQGRITFINDAVRRYGYTPEELIGEPMLSLIHPEDRQKAHYRLDEQCTGKRRTQALEVRLIEKASKPLAAELDNSLLRDVPVLLLNAEDIYSTLHSDTQVWLGTQGVARDITEHKRLEEQFLEAQKLDAVGQLAGGIAHDFNNMLMAILTTCDFMLFTSDADDPKRQEIELIKQAGERAARLTQQILTFSRRQVRHLEALDLDEVIDGMEKLLRELIGEQIELVRQPTPTACKVQADRAQIEQIILNLALNARDSMSRKGTLTIKVEPCQITADSPWRDPSMNPGSYVKLAVMDTGVGMDTATRARIFEPFFTTREVGKGAGLGLSAVFGIVKQNDGFILVDSQPGRGTTFEIFLPILVEENFQTEAPEQPADQRFQGRETVLLIEDDEPVRTQTKRLLSRWGYTVIEACRGAEALELHRRLGPVDLLLTDVIMPDLTGKELADRLTAERPNLKVIYMSGYLDETIAGQGVLESGACFLSKPFTSEALGTTMRELLNRSAGYRFPQAEKGR